MSAVTFTKCDGCAVAIDPGSADAVSFTGKEGDPHGAIISSYRNPPATITIRVGTRIMASGPLGLDFCSADCLARTLKCK